MFNFGFSYVGLIYLLMLFIPNMIWAKHQPEGYTAEGENKILAVFERIGEVLCTCCALIFSNFNISKSNWIGWLVLSFLFMILYEIYWVRYFNSKKTLEDFYKPLFGIKIPGATLPVIAFFLLGIYGTNIFMIISDLILAVGHIGIHMQHCKKLNFKKSKMVVRIVRGFIGLIIGLVLMAIVVVIGMRNFNYSEHYKLIRQGVDEGVYVELGGQEQYLLVRGADKNNPVVIFLHGGPSSPESFVNYCWQNKVLNEYTIIDWDQRGCGRTYIHNKNQDPNNKTVSYEQALTDLDELVNYACKRFSQNKVIIAGHSYGTVLGIDYISRHPDKVSQYVAAAQVVSNDINNQIMAKDAINTATKQNKDAAAIEKAYKDYQNNPCVITTLILRQATAPYLPVALPDKTSKIALASPYMGMDDFSWFLLQIGSMNEYIALNQKLYDELNNYDLYKVNVPSDIPIHFIFGTRDYVCPIESIEDYRNASHIDSDLSVLEDCGHNIQYTKPDDFGKVFLDVLSKR